MSCSITDYSYESVASIPLTSICDVRKFSKKNLPKDKQMFLMDGFEVICSNIQSHRVSDCFAWLNTIYLLLTEFEVHTVNYRLSFFPLISG